MRLYERLFLVLRHGYCHIKLLEAKYCFSLYPSPSESLYLLLITLSPSLQLRLFHCHYYACLEGSGV
jgi:hypothetical protein